MALLVCLCLPAIKDGHVEAQHGAGNLVSGVFGVDLFICSIGKPYEPAHSNCPTQLPVG